MKKNIALAIVFLVICLHNLMAQESATLNASVARAFETDFSGATNVQVEPEQKSVTLIKFLYQDSFWLAYYTKDGRLISSGRKIKSHEQLPVNVKKSLDELQGEYEKKFGSLAVGAPFEMISDGSTSYFVPLQNNSLSLFISIDGYGSASIRSKQVRDAIVIPDKSVIAKKN